MVEKTLSASEHTKQQPASALKVLMAERPMDKITISDLTAICKIRRQSFYYHFKDIYDLLRWMFQNEAISLLQQHEGALRLLRLFRYLEENRAVCLCALKSMGRDHIKRFFEADIYSIIPYHRTARRKYRFKSSVCLFCRYRDADAFLCDRSGRNDGELASR